MTNNTTPELRDVPDDDKPIFGGEIPGVNYLGWGFDIFGTYDSRSATRRLLKLSTEQDKTFEEDGVEYLVPDHVTVLLQRDTFGEARTFSSREKVQSYFSAKAGIEGSYGGFKGQFEGSFSHASESDDEYMFSLYRAGRQSWALQLDNPSEADFTDAVRHDPVYTDLPSHYDAANEWRFFRFFDRYGTHVLRRAEVGFRFHMTTSVQKSYSKDETDIAAKLTVQYKAAFGAKGNAETEWKRLGERWSAATRTQIHALGGDSSMMDAVVVAPGENFQDVYERWRKSAEHEPAIIGLQLEPVWKLFAPEQAAALEQAFGAYLRNRVFVESRTESSLIMVQGKPIVPKDPRPDPADHGGFQVAILDRATLEPKVSEYVAFRWSGVLPVGLAEAYRRLAELLAEHRSPQNLVILASFHQRAETVPSEELYAELLSLGAGNGLEEWRKDRAVLTHSEYRRMVNYCLVGIPSQGIGTGHEALAMASQYPLPAATATLDVEFQRARAEAEQDESDGAGLYLPLVSDRAA